MSPSLGTKGRKRRSAGEMIKGGIHRLAAHRKPPKTAVQQAESAAQPDEKSLNLSRPAETGHLPSNLGDPSDHQHWFRIGPLMCWVLALGLIWIAVLAYFVAGMAER